jgi:hypothetical protein
MYEPVFRLLSFEDLSQDDRTNLVGLMVECLIGINRKWLRRHPETLPFYQYAPKYSLKSRPMGLDSWQDIPTTIALGTGDCKDFSAWRIAEMREAGYPDVGPRVVTREAQGVVVYHVQVRNDIQVEDPSAYLGMPAVMTPAQIKGLITP